ncbi:hypothetical protein L596_010434 [Steinernema carpocapsae]|uniref:Major facilitator superfamily (MFS) profile domain-containing protein n=1 Tax=Steinernema carpocapsae TaxID=34508 RepID=A0A4U5PIB3_STECR|nr:hypothetical protein L596_010434 [Steinernema carpocapsae]
MEAKDALLRKERQMGRECVNPDDVLDELGGSNAYIVFIFISMSFVWFVIAPMCMISAFINESDDSFCLNDTDCKPATSLRSEFNLYGDLSSLPATSVSVGIIGDLVGGFILSAISDKYGRKPAVCIACIFSGVFGVVSAFSPDIYVFTGLKFAQGIFFSGMLVNWVLSYESIPHSIRSYSSIVFGAMWVFGYILLSPIAYYIHDWRSMTVVTSIPPIVAGIFFYLTVPESFHFLVSQGDLAEVKKWMMTAERFGKKKLTITAEQLLEDMAISYPKKKDPEFVNSITDIISNQSLMTDMSIIAYLWVCDGFVYYALSLFSTALAGNQYVNFVLLGLVELPAVMVAPYLLDRFGRKLVVAGCQAVIGISVLTIVFVPTESTYVALILWLIAKGAVSASFNAIFIYGSEVFPTTYRNFCIALCSITSKFLTIFVPHIGAMNAIDPRIPMLIYSFLGITSGMLTLLLPETLNKPLPSTLGDV